MDLYLESCMPLWHELEQTCLFSLKNAVVLSFLCYFPLYRQMCYVALWIKLCVLAWNSSCQIWSVYRWSMVTGTNLCIIQLPDYYFLLIIMVILKLSLFICRSFQSLIEPYCKLQSFCFCQKELLDRGSWTIGHVYFTQFMR